MPIEPRRIPILPSRPCIHPLTGPIRRSYSIGRENFSRACQGEIRRLQIATEEPLPSALQAKLLIALNAKRDEPWTAIPFARTDAHTLTCDVPLESPGLYAFRAVFSLDNGATWLPDTVPDAWVLVDPAQVDGLRLYTLIPTVSGTLQDWTADLPRIQAMGFNAIHLLPVTALDTSESPYSAHDLFDIDHSYLLNRDRESDPRDGLTQLEEFVEAAKSLGIRLCFDLVLNHVGVNSVMARRAPDWIVPDQNQPDGLQRAHYWYDGGWCNWEDLVLINYEHPSEAIRAEIWDYMIDYALFWAKYADYTGGFVRFDNLHGSDPDFIQGMTRTLHAEYPEVGIIAEYFTDKNTLLHTVPNWGLNLTLATPWNYKFVPELRGYLSYLHSVAEHLRYYMPITSHDSGTPAQEFGSVDATIPRYVAAALLGTGATGITQGVEFGVPQKIDFIGRKPKTVFPSEARFAPFLAQINALFTEHPAFRIGDNCVFVDDNHHAILAAFRTDPTGASRGFLVACNFDIHSPQRLIVNLGALLERPSPIPYTDLLAGESRLSPHTYLEILMPPCSAQVLQFPV